MATVYAMIADGSEEVECLAVVDVLKRADIEVVLVSINGSNQITSAHDISIQTDAILEEVDCAKADLIFLPGGMPGSEHLSACGTLIQALRQAETDGRRIAAICAAPAVILGRHGFLEGKTATCFPGFEGELKGAVHTTQGVVTDGNITTARGLGYAIDLGLELVSILRDETTAKIIKDKIQYNY